MRIGMTCVWLLAPAALLLLIASPQSAVTGWAPKRVVGMDYPYYAGRAFVEGEVEITCVIKSDGSVESAIATSPTPHPLLVKDAQQNAMKWVFAKTTGATASTNRFVLKYSFKLMRKKPKDRPTLSDVSEDISEFVFEYPNQVTITFSLGKSPGLHGM